MPTTKTMPKQIISANSMTDFMANINRANQDPTGKKVGARFVTIFTKTVPAMIAGHPFGDDLLKVSHVQMNLGVSYANCVNAQRGRENLPQDFVAKNRKWGTPVMGTPFVLHTNKITKKNPDPQPQLYLAGKVERSVEHWYEDRAGNEIPTHQVEKWLRPKSPTRQGTNKDTYWRTYGLDKVLGFKFGQTLWVVQDNLTLLKDIAAVRE